MCVLCASIPRVLRAHAARVLRHAGLGGGQAAAGDAVAVHAVHAKHECLVLGALAVLGPLRIACARQRLIEASRMGAVPQRALLQSSGCLSSHVFGMPSCNPLNLLVCILRAGSEHAQQPVDEVAHGPFGGCPLFTLDDGAGGVHAALVLLAGERHVPKKDGIAGARLDGGSSLRALRTHVRSETVQQSSSSAARHAPLRSFRPPSSRPRQPTAT